jgi:dipeptidyl aminopeptidase/acylaminoacyl peptidase
MKNNKFSLFLLLAGLASGCIVPAQLPGLTGTAPGPAAIDTLTYTPTPPSTPVGFRNTPAPTLTPPAVEVTPQPPLATSGPYMAYHRQEGGQAAIIFLDADGKGQKRFSYPPNAAPETIGLSLSSVLSPDGKWLAYYSGSAGTCFGNGTPNSGDLSLNLISLTDGKTSLITQLLSNDYPNNFVKAAQELNHVDINAEMLQDAFICGLMESIAWSPDGNFLAFAGQMDGLSSDLYLYDTVAGTIKRLSSGPQEVQWITWSPDGKWILDGSSYWVGEGMRFDIYATSTDGDTVKLLSKNTPSVVGPGSWLNDHAYFDSDGYNGPGPFDLKLVNVETGKTVEVWNGSYGPFAFISHGNWVALYANTPVWPYPYNSDFQTGIFLVNTTSLSQTRVNSLGTDGCCLGTTVEALGSTQDRLFLVRESTGQDLQYLSSDGKLAPAGIQADKFSVSPDRNYWVAITTRLQVFSADGSSIRTVDLPANLTSQEIRAIIWRPDASGLFITCQDPLDFNSPGQLYAMDLSKGNLEQVDSLSPSQFTGFVWVGGAK